MLHYSQDDVMDSKRRLVEAVHQFMETLANNQVRIVKCQCLVTYKHAFFTKPRVHLSSESLSIVSLFVSAFSMFY